MFLFFLQQVCNAQYYYPVRKDVSFHGAQVDMQKRFTAYINNTGNPYWIKARQLSLEGMKLNDAMENNKAIICYIKAELLLIESNSDAPVKDVLLADILQNKGRTYHYVGRPESGVFCNDSKKLNEILIYNKDPEIARFAYFFLATNYDMLDGIATWGERKPNPQLAHTAVHIKQDILNIHSAELGRSYWNYAGSFPPPVDKKTGHDSLIYYDKLALNEFNADKNLDRIYNGEFISSSNMQLCTRYMEVYGKIDSCQFYLEKAIGSLLIKGSYKLSQQLTGFLDYEEMIRQSRTISLVLTWLYDKTQNKTYLNLADDILDSAAARMSIYSAETFNQGIRNAGEMNEINKYTLRLLTNKEKFPLEEELGIKFITKLENAKAFNYKKRLCENEIINLAKNGKSEILDIRKLNALYTKTERERTAIPHTEYLQKNLSVLSKIDSLQQLSYKKQIQKSFDDTHENVDIRNIPVTLKENQAILMYQNDMVGICSVISKKGFKVHMLSFSEERNRQLDNLQYMLMAAQRTNDSGWTNLSNRIYKWLVEPFIQDTGIKELIIIPSGNLSRIPFEAFVTGFKKNTSGNFTHSYLINNYSIRYEYSLEPFYRKANKDVNNSGEQIFAFAPLYEKLDDNSSQNNKSSNRGLRAEAGPLLYNVKEVNEILKGKKGCIFINEQATEKKFREVARVADILHLALHGFSRTDDPMYSGLVFSKNKESDNIQSSYINNDSIYWNDDGIIYAYEIYQMHLRSDMIVLSACETGIGAYEAGEGSRSLGLAFRYAGCNNTVMSLWKVDDERTQKLMSLFYNFLKQGKPKAAALALAKREFINRYPTAGPAYWAGFILFGDNEAIHFEEQSNRFPWLILVIGMLLVSLFLFLLIRRRKNNAAHSLL